MEIKHWLSYTSKFIMISALSFSSAVAIAAVRCDQMFSDVKTTNRLLEQTRAKRGPLPQRIQELIQKYPNHIALVDNVQIEPIKSTYDSDYNLVRELSPEGFRGQNKLLVVSLKDTSREFRDQLYKDYISAISFRTVSFPLSERGGHLYTRFGAKTYDKIWTFTKSEYYMSGGRLEPLIELNEAEFNNLANYIDNVTKNHSDVLNSFDNNGINQPIANSTLFSNKSDRGENHNCTSWITTARIGVNGETLQELVGGVQYNIGTNPGWWSNFLNSVANRNKVPFAVYFNSEKSLNEISEMLNATGTKKLEWDYYLH